MDYQITAIDEYNFSLALRNGVEIGKFRGEEYLGYYLDIPTEKEYYIFLNYLKRVFHQDNISPIFQTDGIWEEEIYCYITENILVRYDFYTEDVTVKIVGDYHADRTYDEIFVDFYTSPEYAAL